MTFRKIITCGANDGDVRIWKEISDDDPLNFCIGETAVCCAQYTCNEKSRLIASTDNNAVQCFLFPSGDRDGVLFHFTAPVTTLKISEKVSTNKSLLSSFVIIQVNLLSVDRCWIRGLYNQSSEARID